MEASAPRAQGSPSWPVEGSHCTGPLAHPAPAGPGWGPEGGPPPGAVASQLVTPRPGCKRPRAACVTLSEAQGSLLSLPFPRKLWEIVSSPQFESIRWHSSGTCIVINQKLFEKEILDRQGPSKVFETDCMKSFLRQLNLYGFSKIWQDESTPVCLDHVSTEEAPSHEPSKLQFYCSLLFRRDSPQLLARMQRRTRSRAALKQREGAPQAPPLALAATSATARPEAAGSRTAGLQTPARAELPLDAAAAPARRDPVLPTAAGRPAQPAARPIAASSPYWPVGSLAGGRPRGLSAPTSQLSTASVLTWCHPLGSMPIMSPGPAGPGLAVPHLPSPFCWPSPRYFPAYRPPPHGPADRADDPR
ncbi:heat shock transcription factor, X-linked-like [Talpa occidentalis]|uniref:heat shock transcription factor, X-linked-like n=1 Tax=Talpa occidentalis TaxID=50954 RepID=UPI00188FF433|nr:heat shock transcription factor, X-linked-like [Talpa occidentalis]